MMARSKIEWLKNPDGSQGYSINPVKGLCPMACSYCYARRMYNNPFYASLYNHRQIEWQPYAFSGLYTVKKSSRIFVGSTMELFGDWVKPEWMNVVFQTVKAFPQHTFIFLTKCPQNLAKWSPFPPNVWVGVSTPKASDAINANKYMANIEATVKFLSIEPMLEWDLYPETLVSILMGYDWLIAGSQTQPVHHPPLRSVISLKSAANELKTPIFVKEPMASHYGINRKEFPCANGEM